MLLVILKAKELLKHFTKKNYKKKKKKKNRREFRIEKVIKKAINYMLNWKATTILSTVWLKKRHSISECIFSKQKSLGKNVKVELDLSNYGTNASYFAKKNWFS